MNNREKKLRPAFRVLAGILTVGNAFGVVMAFYEIVNHINVGRPWAFLGGCLFNGLIFGFVALKGKVPNWLIRQQ